MSQLGSADLRAGQSLPGPLSCGWVTLLLTLEPRALGGIRIGVPGALGKGGPVCMPDAGAQGREALVHAGWAVSHGRCNQL